MNRWQATGLRLQVRRARVRAAQRCQKVIGEQSNFGREAELATGLQSKQERREQVLQPGNRWLTNK